jgi:hypothetical protein
MRGQRSERRKGKCVDRVVMVAERDGGVCGLCRCAILKGDVLFHYTEYGIREHRCCREARDDPRPRVCDRYV